MKGSFRVIKSTELGLSFGLMGGSIVDYGRMESSMGVVHTTAQMELQKRGNGLKARESAGVNNILLYLHIKLVMRI